MLAPGVLPDTKAAKERRMSQDATKDPLVIFTPSGKRGRVAAGTPVLQAARALGAVSYTHLTLPTIYSV